MLYYFILCYIMLYHYIILYHLYHIYYTRCPKKMIHKILFFLLNLTVTELYQTILVRGGIKIENRENLGQCPNRGGGVKKTQKCPNFNLGIFQKCPNLVRRSQRSEGGEGSTLIGTLSQIFSIFYFDASPNPVTWF